MNSAERSKEIDRLLKLSENLLESTIKTGIENDKAREAAEKYRKEEREAAEKYRKEEREAVEQYRREDKDSIEKFRQRAEKDRKDMSEFTRQMIQEIRDSTKSINKTIGNYINNESDLIEKEINGHIRNYLAKDPKFLKYTIFDITNIWKFLKEPEIIGNSKDNNIINKTTITDFDGIFILSNDDSYFPLNINDRTIVRLRKNSTTSSSEDKIKKFVIVEAKHCLDNAELKKKIEQIKRFQQYLEEARKYQQNTDKYTLEFKNKVSSYKLNEFTTDIILIFGSEDMGKNQIELITSNYDEWLNKKIEVSYLTPSGGRYSLYCYNNANNLYEQNKNIYNNVVASKISVTGAGKKKSNKNITIR
jgi:hypothetical protein